MIRCYSPSPDVKSAAIAVTFFAKGIPMKAQKLLLTGLLLSCVLCSAAVAEAEGKSQAIGSAKSAPHVRTYYLCAEEIDWDYTPDGKDVMILCQQLANMPHLVLKIVLSGFL